MKGLEISEVLLSKVFEIETHRLDSEFQRKKYINLEKVINKGNFTTFSNLGLKVDASAFYPSLEPYYDTGNLPFLRVADVDKNIDYDKCVKIPNRVANSEEFSTLKIIQKGDIIITKGGSVGRVGLISKKTAVTRDLIFINSSTLREQDYKFLFLYLLSNINYDLMIRSSSMTAQPHLTIKLIRELPIFQSKNNFIKDVVAIYDKSEVSLQNSKQLYTQAEEILLKELGLQDFKPSKEPVNIKSFKDSFGTSGRLDAEYYQKKYEEVIEKIISKKYDTLSNIVTIKKSIEPGSDNYDDNGLPFLRVADYSKFGLTKPQKYLKENFIADNKKQLENLKPKKGTILFSKDGSVGTAYHLREDFNGITSGAILHLSVKDESKIIPEYLTLVLNSRLVQMQAERDAGGSIILHWRVSEIANVVVPIIDFDKQQQIANLIEESFSLKKQSEHLLEVAKKSVEIAIEENETVAMEFIKREIL